MKASRASRSRSRGMTLLEIMVAVAVLAGISVLIHGVMTSLSAGKKGEGERGERVHQAREAMQRIVRDLSSAYISMHIPSVLALQTERTAFVGRNSIPYDRLDFTAFAHMRTERDSHESDQAEIGYFVVRDPEVDDKMDLVRREQTPIDYEPLKGGIINVVAENVQEFHLRYLDPLTSQWVLAWDSQQVTGQPNRLPLEVEITIVLKPVGPGAPYSYTTKIFLPIQQPLSFGIQQ